MKQKAPYPLRIDDLLAMKLKKLAKDNDRSYRAQIENILRKYVAEYERENGEIIVDKSTESEFSCNITVHNMNMDYIAVKKTAQKNAKSCIVRRSFYNNKQNFLTWHLDHLLP